jgi:hypothetical protein
MLDDGKEIRRVWWSYEALAMSDLGHFISKKNYSDDSGLVEELMTEEKLADPTLTRCLTFRMQRTSMACKLDAESVVTMQPSVFTSHLDRGFHLSVYFSSNTNPATADPLVLWSRNAEETRTVKGKTMQRQTIPLDEDGYHQKQMVERVANILEAELEYLKDMYKPTVFEDEAKTLQERNANFWFRVTSPSTFRRQRNV